MQHMNLDLRERERESKQKVQTLTHIITAKLKSQATLGGGANDTDIIRVKVS